MSSPDPQQSFHLGLAYCGSPPSPDAILARWNLDPVLLAALGIIAALYWLGTRKSPRSRLERGCFSAGFLILSLALVSPLCALSVSLFSARVGQHMLLSLVAVPLLVLGRFVPTVYALVSRRELPAAPPLLASMVFALLIWAWHSPYAYDATFDGAGVYWAMHVSVIAAALFLWSALLDPSPGRAVGVIGTGLISTVQMGLLGAIITFAPEPLFAAHLLTAPAWGLTALQDQQLGGVVMWVPGCAAFLASAMATFWQLLSNPAPSVRGPARPA